MLDFVRISERSPKRGVINVYPKFLIKPSKDLMIRGGDFYAVWVQEHNIWSLDEHDAIAIIDQMLQEYVESHKEEFNIKYDEVHTLYMYDASSRMIDDWHKYCQKQRRDAFHSLDEKLIFSNMEMAKSDYATRKLGYPLEEGDITSYNKLISTLYTEDERRKIEWAIGAVVTGDSVNIQKFLVLYGSHGTGKSTILNIIQQLFEGYYTVFDAKALGSTTNSFALESFKTNPLVAIQHDGDLSKIADNTRLNSLVSHEVMTVNEKFKAAYAATFKCFLFMGTNKPVKITDAKSGLIRRLIDVSPSGEKLSPKDYKMTVKQIDFELGAIAYHCKEVYLKNPGKYDNYIPTVMLGASNDFYNFMEDGYFIFKDEGGVTLKTAWERYKTYNDESKVQYPLPLRAFKEELKNYFRDFHERFTVNGARIRNYYDGFRYDKFEKLNDEEEYEEEDVEEDANIILFNGITSPMDLLCKDCLAQYTTSEGNPISKWENVTTTLKDIDTTQLHYVRIPENHIVIDFDITDEAGEKSLELNLKEASKLPATYTEVSKSGAGIHLHYIYSGDATKLARVYGDHIEVKVFVGHASLRRKLSIFNDQPINTISSGLPLKGVDKVVNFDAVKSEKAIRTLLHKNLNKEIHAGTKPSIDFIYKILEDAYDSDLNYDVSDMHNVIFAFAASSSHQADYCMDLVDKMHFKSKEISSVSSKDDQKMVFFDVEVFPNLFIVNWKIEGPEKPVMRMINPSSQDIENLMKLKLVGFNCRRYDNHILYGRLLGFSNKQLYELSQKIIQGKPNCYFGEAWNISYTDVYDFSAEKKSLKKFEISLGIHHQELGLAWDQPVPEELWIKVAEYCDNDVLATEAVFIEKKGDFLARQILAELAGMTVNDTTNTLSTRFIFGTNKEPQSSFNYRNMGEEHDDDVGFVFTEKWMMYDFPGDAFTRFTADGQPVFPGYKYELGKSTYRGEEVGEGGYVYAEPGMYSDIALLDVASMHPTSAILEQLFGPEFTKKFEEIVKIRLAIKHKDFDSARKMLDGALAKFLDDEDIAKVLAYALKIVINSVYGLTSAKFSNPFKDPRNVDNIVAKRGALFMINLKHAVQDRGFTVAHVKTDSIKIPNATPEIIQFVTDYGEEYGYTFEHEATYGKMCLVNDAVYIANYASKEKCEELYDGYIPDDNKYHPNVWTATGTQFAVPYVFKTLFSKEDIVFKDLCETKAVTSALYLDLNEHLPSVVEEEKERDKIWKKLLSDAIIENDVVAEMEKRLEELDDIIEKGHLYKFIGKVGLFCPMMDGYKGGWLLRETCNAKTGQKGYASATGAKGYRWMESEIVNTLGKEAGINYAFYNKLVEDALDSIRKYGDAEWFMSKG